MKKVGIVMGSDSDLPILEKAMNMLKSLEVPYEVHVYSAHRTPDQAIAFARGAEEKGFGVLKNTGCALTVFQKRAWGI